MHRRQRDAFNQEMTAGSAALAADDVAGAFVHFARAHILGQRDTVAHTRSHIAMLRAGWRLRDPREIVGQCTRILASLVFSRIWVPAGNTGRANVSAVRPMPVPDDLARLLEDR